MSEDRPGFYLPLLLAGAVRALVDDLKQQMSDAEFDAALKKGIDAIYEASTVKV